MQHAVRAPVAVGAADGRPDARAGRTARAVLLVVLLVVCGWPGVARAHSLGSGFFAHRLEVRVQAEWVRVTYSAEIPMSVLQGEFVRAMLDEPQGTDGAQIQERLRREKAERLVSGIEIVLNGARLVVEEDPDAERITRPNDEVFLLFRYALRARVLGGLLERNRLVVRNSNYPRQRSVYSHTVELSAPLGGLSPEPETKERFEVDPRTQIRWYFSGRYRDLDISFDREGARAGGSAQAGAKPGGSDAAVGDSTAQRLERFLRTPDWSVRWVALALLVAFFLGGAHALSPGHGKTVVAAYLIGTRGRLRDAAVLGLSVTLTHTSTVFVLGLITLFLSQTILPETLAPYLAFVSGALITGVGGWMLVTRARALGRPHDHSHGHEHGHGHGQAHGGAEHEHELEHAHAHAHGQAHGQAHGGAEQRVTLRGLVSLGISGGLVPCPSALVVLLAAVAYRRIALGLAMVVAFSAGLAAVLIAIGVILVLATRAARRVAEPGPWVRWLPVFSALVIVVLGVAMCVKVLIGDGAAVVGS